MAISSPDTGPAQSNEIDLQASLEAAGLKPEEYAELLPVVKLARLVSDVTVELAEGLGQRFGRQRF